MPIQMGSRCPHRYFRSEPKTRSRHAGVPLPIINDNTSLHLGHLGLKMPQSPQTNTSPIYYFIRSRSCAGSFTSTHTYLYPQRQCTHQGGEYLESIQVGRSNLYLEVQIVQITSKAKVKANSRYSATQVDLLKVVGLSSLNILRISTSDLNCTYSNKIIECKSNKILNKNKFTFYRQISKKIYQFQNTPQISTNVVL